MTRIVPGSLSPGGRHIGEVHAEPFSRGSGLWLVHGAHVLAA